MNCGLCRKNCPLSAIDKDPAVTRHGECITCRRCVQVCPVKAVRFAWRGRKTKKERPPDQQRRAFVAGGTTLLVAGGLLSPLSWAAKTPDFSLRPPGSRPEPDFLKRCISCGACMAACPTNTLQPSGFDHHWLALLTPLLTPVSGPCRTDCNRCGQVCPTAAILPLTVDEKLWARPGTAHIHKRLCIAWQDEQACLVCDEVCPFDAIILVQAAGISHSVPEVIPNRCSGCGYCEYECPVEGKKAIVVTTRGAIRLNENSHREKGIKKGLDIRLDSGEFYSFGEEGQQGLPPGFLPE